MLLVMRWGTQMWHGYWTSCPLELLVHQTHDERGTIEYTIEYTIESVFQNGICSVCRSDGLLRLIVDPGVPIRDQFTPPPALLDAFNRRFIIG